MLKKLAALVSITLLTATSYGCASNPKDLPTSYVSTVEYQNYDCDQLVREISRVRSRIEALHASLATKAKNDNIQAAVGIVLFWPALFFLEGGDGAEAQEYSRLKGELEALEKRAIDAKC